MSEEATRLLPHKVREKHQEVNNQNLAFMKKSEKYFAIVAEFRRSWRLTGKITA
jgi:hypothetical protein